MSDFFYSTTTKPIIIFSLTILLITSGILPYAFAQSVTPSPTVSPAISIKPDKTSYTFGEIATMRLQVEKALSKAPIKISIIDPKGNTYLQINPVPDNNGTVELKFEVKQSFPAGRWNILAKSNIASGKSSFEIPLPLSGTALCNQELTQIDLPSGFRTTDDQLLDSVEEVINYLGKRNVNSTSDIFSNTRNAKEFSTFAGKLGLDRDTVLKMALRAELSCVMEPVILPASPKLPSDMQNLRLLLNLLNDAGFRSVSQIARIDLNSTSQVESLSVYLYKLASAMGGRYAMFTLQTSSGGGESGVDELVDTTGTGTTPGLKLTPFPQISEMVVPIINATKGVTPLYYTDFDNEQIVFPDKSFIVITDGSDDSAIIRKTLGCNPVDLQFLQDGFHIDVSKESILHLQISLPFYEPALTAKVYAVSTFSDEKPNLGVFRNLPKEGSFISVPLELPTQSFAYRTDMHVWVPDGGDYFVSLPNVADLAAKHKEIAGQPGMICYDIIEPRSAEGVKGDTPFVDDKGTAEIGDDRVYYDYTASVDASGNPKFYHFSAPSADQFFLHLVAESGTADYIIKAPAGLPPEAPDNLGTVNSDSAIEYEYDGSVTSDKLRRQWFVLLGQFKEICAYDCLVSGNNMPSFFQKPTFASITLEWQLAEQPMEYFVTSLHQTVFSNDAEPASKGEGEMVTRIRNNLVKADGTITDTFSMQYPHYNYREADDRGKQENHPYYRGQIPVMALPLSELSQYSNDELMINAYEDDNGLIYDLVNFAKFVYTLGTGIAHLVTCVGGAVVSCALLVCDVLKTVAAGDAFFSSEEDENMGTAISYFTPADNFGLAEATSTSFTTTGFHSLDASLYDKLGVLGTACGDLISASDALANSQGTFEVLKNLGKYLWTLAKSSKNIEDLDVENSRWVNATLEHNLIQAVPTIEELQVRLKSIEVFNHRDDDSGGEIYTYTTVGTIGDKGTLPADGTWEAHPIADVILDTDGKILQRLPFADTDVMRYPQPIEHCGTVRGEEVCWESMPLAWAGRGDTIDIDKTVFARKYSGSQTIAGLYIEVVSFDQDDSNDDDEIGVISQFYDSSTLSIAVDYCLQGLPGYEETEDGWCKKTQYVIAKNRAIIDTNGQGSEYTGSGITYEIWIKPR